LPFCNFFHALFVISLPSSSKYFCASPEAGAEAAVCACGMK
jgi:hypothetical protein